MKGGQGVKRKGQGGQGGKFGRMRSEFLFCMAYAILFTHFTLYEYIRKKGVNL